MHYKKCIIFTILCSMLFSNITYANCDNISIKENIIYKAQFENVKNIITSNLYKGNKIHSLNTDDLKNAFEESDVSFSEEFDDYVDYEDEEIFDEEEYYEEDNEQDFYEDEEDFENEYDDIRDVINNYEEGSLGTDSWLDSTLTNLKFADFDTSLFQVQEMPDCVSSINSQYLEMVATYEESGFGEKKDLMKLESLNYTKTALSLFEEKYGDIDFTLEKAEIPKSFDVNKVIEDAKTEREKTFSQVKSTGVFNSVSNSLNIESLISEVNAGFTKKNTLDTSSYTNFVDKIKNDTSNSSSENNDLKNLMKKINESSDKIDEASYNSIQNANLKTDKFLSKNSVKKGYKSDTYQDIYDTCRNMTTSKIDGDININFKKVVQKAEGLTDYSCGSFSDDGVTYILTFKKGSNVKTIKLSKNAKALSAYKSALASLSKGDNLTTLINNAYMKNDVASSELTGDYSLYENDNNTKLCNDALDSIGMILYQCTSGYSSFSTGSLKEIYDAESRLKSLNGRKIIKNDNSTCEYTYAELSKCLIAYFKNQKYSGNRFSFSYNGGKIVFSGQKDITFSNTELNSFISKISSFVTANPVNWNDLKSQETIKEKMFDEIVTSVVNSNSLS